MPNRNQPNNPTREKYGYVPVKMTGTGEEGMGEVWRRLVKPPPSMIGQPPNTANRAATVLLAAWILSGASAQEDFRNKPWRDLEDTSAVVVKVTSTGELLGPIPQYLFNATHWPHQGATGIVVQVVQPDGQPIGPGTWHAELTALVKAAHDSVLASPQRFEELLDLAFPGTTPAQLVSIMDEAMQHPAALRAMQPFVPVELDARLDGNAYERIKYKLGMKIGGGRSGTRAVLPNMRIDLKGPPLASHDGAVRWSVVAEDQQAALLFRWITALKTRHKADLDRLLKAGDDARMAIQKLVVELDASSDETICVALSSKLKDQKTKLDAVAQETRKLLAAWMLEWAWYTGGALRVDPFNSGAADCDPPTKAEVDSLERRFNAFKKDMDCCAAGDATPALLNARLAAFEKAKLEFESVKKRFDDHEARKKIPALDADKELYDGLLHLSTNQQAHFMRHTSATKKWRSFEGGLRTEFYTFEKVHFLVHNHTGDSAHLALTHSASDASHTSSLSKEIDPALTTASGLISGTKGGVAALLPLLANPRQNLRPSDRVEIRSLHKDDYPDYEIKTFESILKGPDECSRIRKGLFPDLSVSVLQWVADSCSLATVSRILSYSRSAKPTAADHYSTEVLPEESIPAGKAISYEVSLVKDPAKPAEKTILGKGKFNSWEPKRIQVFGGLAWSPDSVERVTVSSAGAVERKNEQAGFLMGIKVHPFGHGTEIDDDRLALVPRRIGLAVGLGLPTPLDDLYAGITYDVYPGINVGALWHFYRCEGAQFENGKVVEERVYYKGSPYPAATISLDSSLFTNLLKLFAQ